MSSVTTPTWARTSEIRWTPGPNTERTRVGRLDRVGGGLEAGGRPLDDRPQDVLLRGDVGVQAGALDVDRARDVADARARVAVLVEERAGRVLDLRRRVVSTIVGRGPLTNAC